MSLRRYGKVPALTRHMCSRFDWASQALAAVSRRAATFEHSIEHSSISRSAASTLSDAARLRLGLLAAWGAWSDVASMYYDDDDDLASTAPIHSKCVGFTSGSNYYAVYLMDRASLADGNYRCVPSMTSWSTR